MIDTTTIWFKMVQVPCFYLKDIGVDNIELLKYQTQG